jgi:HEAT repeat protein
MALVSCSVCWGQSKQIKELGHKDPAVRLEAARRLGELGPRAARAASALAQALQDDDSKVVKAARAALRRLGAAAVPALVRSLRRSRAWPVWGSAFLGEALVAVGPAAIPATIGLLGDRRGHVRSAAAEALASIGAPAARALERALRESAKTKKKAKTPRWRLVHALGAMVPAREAPPDPRASAAEKRRVADMNRVARRAADAAVPVLEAALKDRESSVRAEAASALGGGGKRAVPALKRALKDPDHVVRWMAVRSLARIGKQARSAGPELEKALRDLDASVRRDAQVALSLMGRKVKPPVAASPAGLPKGVRTKGAVLIIGRRKIVLRDRIYRVIPNPNPQLPLLAVMTTPNPKHDASDGVTDLYLVDRASGRHRRFRFTAGDVFGARELANLWSPDGTYMVVLMERYGPFRVMRARELRRWIAGGRVWTKSVRVRSFSEVSPAKSYGLLGWISPSELAFSWACCDTMSFASYDLRFELPDTRRHGHCRHNDHRCQKRRERMLGASPPSGASAWDTTKRSARLQKRIYAARKRQKHKLVPDLVAALKDREPAVRRVAADGLAKLGLRAVKTVPALCVALNDSHCGVRSAAAYALGDIGPAASAAAVPALQRALVPTCGHDAAILALGQLGLAAVPALARALGSRYGKVRQSAARALAHHGSGALPAVPALTKALTDSNPEVVQEAARALEAIGLGAASATRALIRATKSRNSDVREAAARALGSLGPRARIALPRLRRLLKDRSESVQYAAEEAIDSLKTKSRNDRKKK